MKVYKKETDIFLEVKQKIYDKYGDMAKVKSDEYTTALLQDDMELFEAYHNVMMDMVQEYINFYYNVDKDLVKNTFTETELTEAYINIKNLASEKDVDKKKHLKRK